MVRVRSLGVKERRPTPPGSMHRRPQDSTRKCQSGASRQKVLQAALKKKKKTALLDTDHDAEVAESV